MHACRKNTDFMDIIGILDHMIDDKIDELKKYGYILGGHNGPYYDTETPVRNTAHWATIFAYYYKKTNKKEYYDATKICAEYLISKEARPMEGSFFCRHKTKRDFSNGTIGTAWAIEGLISSYEVLNDIYYLEYATEVFLLFPFSESRYLWRIINVDGSEGAFDMTFNHQLWFAAVGVMILSEKEIKEIRRRCNLFFDNIENIMGTHKNGLIIHSIFNKFGKINTLKSVLREIRNIVIKITTGKSMLYKENGYHLFNLYAFALIKNSGYDLKFLKNKKFEKILHYCFSDELHDWLINKAKNMDFGLMEGVKNHRVNIYGYSYNAPGFELPYIYSIFRDRLPNMDEFVKCVIEKQIELTYDEQKNSFCKNTDDSNTLNARTYEFLKGVAFFQLG